MSLDAFMLILPLPSIVMSLPLIVMDPSFFIRMLASPVVIVTDSPAVKERFFSTFNVSSLLTLDWRLTETEWFSSSHIDLDAFLLILSVWFMPMLFAMVRAELSVCMAYAVF